MKLRMLSLEADNTDMKQRINVLETDNTNLKLKIDTDGDRLRNLEKIYRNSIKDNSNFTNKLETTNIRIQDLEKQGVLFKVSYTTYFATCHFSHGYFFDDNVYFLTIPNSNNDTFYIITDHLN